MLKPTWCEHLKKASYQEKFTIVYKQKLTTTAVCINIYFAILSLMNWIVALKDRLFLVLESEISYGRSTTIRSLSEGVKTKYQAG